MEVAYENILDSRNDATMLPNIALLLWQHYVTSECNFEIHLQVNHSCSTWSIWKLREIKSLTHVKNNALHWMPGKW